MRLPSRRQNLVVWDSSATRSRPARSRNGRRPARTRRIRRWLRTGTLLLVLGVLGAVRAARARWEPVSLLVGGLLAVVGLLVPVVPAFFVGLLILIVALLAGIASHGKGVSQSADCWNWPA